MEEYRPGIPPQSPQEKIKGLKVAIAATEYRIKTSGDGADLESHLQSLQEQLKILEQEVADKLIAK